MKGRNSNRNRKERTKEREVERWKRSGLFVVKHSCFAEATKLLQNREYYNQPRIGLYTPTLSGNNDSAPTINRLETTA
jgi:hypothetical protein